MTSDLVRPDFLASASMALMCAVETRTDMILSFCCIENDVDTASYVCQTGMMQTNADLKKKFADFTAFALSKCNKNLSPSQFQDMIHAGLLGETGEVIDLLKKELFHGRAIPREKYLEELGDMLFYASLLPDGQPSAPAFSAILSTKGDFEDARLIALSQVLLFASMRMGNRMWTCSLVLATAERFGFGVEEVIEANIAKINKRYPDGFTTEASIARAGEVSQ